jgi:hypothetical protein
LICTVQAPHNATPQPNLVPVRPSSSRKYHMSGIGIAPECSLLFIDLDIHHERFPPFENAQSVFFSALRLRMRKRLFNVTPHSRMLKLQNSVRCG